MLQSFVRALQKAIAHKLQLHNLITQDIGYLWNEWCQEKLDKAYEKNSEWIGWKNMVWNSDGGGTQALNTWLYNDSKGKIIFEITPDYNWHDPDAQMNVPFIPYEEFIKNYKPYIIREVPLDIAKIWLAKAKAIIKIINSPDEEKVKLITKIEN